MSGQDLGCWQGREHPQGFGGFGVCGGCRDDPHRVGFVPKSACCFPAGMLQGAPAPTEGGSSPRPHHGRVWETFPLGPSPNLSPQPTPAGLCVCPPSSPGRNSRGLSQLRVNIGFSGAVTPPQQHRRGFHSLGPCRPLFPPQKKKQKTLPGQAGLLLPYKPGHGAGITAISGSGVWVLCCGVVWRGLCSPPGNAGGLLTPLFGVNLAPGSATGSLGGHSPGGCSPTKPSPDPSQPHRMGARPCRVPTRPRGVHGGVGGSA